MSEFIIGELCYLYAGTKCFGCYDDFEEYYGPGPKWLDIKYILSTNISIVMFLGANSNVGYTDTCKIIYKGKTVCVLLGLLKPWKNNAA